jgi:hypothetical protein
MYICCWIYLLWMLLNEPELILILLWGNYNMPPTGAGTWGCPYQRQQFKVISNPKWRIIGLMFYFKTISFKNWFLQLITIHIQEINEC